MIGYGNELRRDDGVGPLVARAVEGWGWPGVVGLAVHGLPPELSEVVAQAENVLFVDADRRGGGELLVTEVRPGLEPHLGHISDPPWLVALGERLWGHRPRAWMVAVPVADLGIGEGLSELALRGMEAALEYVRQAAGAACAEPHTG